MNFLSLLYASLIKPLELIFEFIFFRANIIMKNPVLSITVLSLAVNIMVLPLYRRADAMQAEEKELEEKLSFGVKHIKKTFKGDERYMVLQTFYRQNGYKPYYALRGMVPLLLEIPFFIAAYHFLSNLSMLRGVSFGPIGDLSTPDALIDIGGIAINILPFLMTAINIVSSMIYSEHLSKKGKVQLYAMAGVFLVLLYDSPSGLVFYWTLNNLFSLGKNVVYRFLPEKKTVPEPDHIEKDDKTSYWAFALPGIFAAVLIGALIPSAVIVSSTAEFVNVDNVFSPVRYVVETLAVSTGAFLVWPSLFYYLANEKWRKVLFAFMCIFATLAALDYMLIGTDLGTLSPNLVYDNKLSYSTKEQIISIVLIAGSAIVCILLCRYQQRIMISVMAAGIAASGIMGYQNINRISGEYKEIVRLLDNNIDIFGKSPQISLSKNGKNVVVIMMDRMVGYYIPYLIKEKPEIRRMLDGFTYYPQTVSFGCQTNFGAPGLFGGYEYTPKEMNKRDTELLVDKHDEALKVMPVVFDNAGYDVTVFDPPYAGYREIPDLSIYDDYPRIKKSTIIGKFSEDSGETEFLLKRNFFCFALFKTSPALIQPIVYNMGNYCSTTWFTPKISNGENIALSHSQIRESLSEAYGYNRAFLRSWEVLDNLPGITEASDKDNGSFIMMTNNTTHSPMILKEPEYIPVYNVDNSDIDPELRIKSREDGNEKDFYDDQNYPHYHVNMATILSLGRWFDKLKEMGVYDNTRIIIVSDHSWLLGDVADMHWAFDCESREGEKLTSKAFDFSVLNCTLMVKDFDSKGFHTDETFMTNADVPTISFNDIISDPINPFTGRHIDSSYKDTERIDVMYSQNRKIEENNGYIFMPEWWFSVEGDIYDRDSWQYQGYH